MYSAYDENFTNFEAYDYLVFAKELYDKIETFDVSSKSAIIRTILSRAFYSIFLEIREYLKNTQTDYDHFMGSEHEYIIKYLESHNVFDLDITFILVDTLVILKKYRVFSDYYFEKPFNSRKHNLPIGTILRKCENFFFLIY